MRKFLAIAAVLCCTLGLFADAKPAFTQVTFGLIAGNPLAVTVGADIDWKVWEKPVSRAHDGSGKMYAGLDLSIHAGVGASGGFSGEFLFPILAQGNFMYEFDTTQMPGAGPLKAVGPYISLGLALNPHIHYYYANHEKKSAHFAFGLGHALGIGASFAFNNNWGLKVGFGSDTSFDIVKIKKEGEYWNHDWHGYGYGMAEATYRF